MVIEMPFWLSKCHSGYRFGYRNAILVIEMPFWLSKCHSGYRSGYRNAILVIGLVIEMPLWLSVQIIKIKFFEILTITSRALSTSAFH